MAYENLAGLVANKLGVSSDLSICSKTTLADEVRTGIGLGQGLMNNWMNGSNNCGEIKKNLSSFKQFILSDTSSKGIDPYFFLGLVATESQGNPCAGAGNRYKGMGQTEDSVIGTSYENCKDQVKKSTDHMLSKSNATGASMANAMVVSTAYNCGESLFVSTLKSSDPTYKQIYDAVDGYRQKQGWGSGKIQEIRSYYIRILAAWYVIKDQSFLGSTGYEWGVGGSGTPGTSSYSDGDSSSVKTTSSFKTNPATDWLLDPTEDEKKYGINIYEGEQPLIKFSTYSAISEHGDCIGALKKYSEFLYYLLNSEVTTSQVTCVGMPWIRPGFNVWLDPLYSDAVYYCRGVQHQGDPMNGATTSLSLVLGRNRQAFINDSDRFGSFKNNSDNVFISDMKDEYRVDKFGSCLASDADFENIKRASENYYATESFETTDAKDSEFHKQMYVYNSDDSPKPQYIDEDKIFSKAYTESEINEQLKSLYEKSPEVVQERRSKLKSAVKQAEEYFNKYHILEKHTFE